ncbi:TPA: type III secretion system needle complex protein [Escherichia fergusonii]|uniref:type III secretion system needle complex protein n=1 Tax=Escherichia fergusonii TaxID=564 RepID=UPI000F66CF4F|nr:type III secretion system needle complex protein [Escherichia fergusonii]EHG5998744.1 type III secretion system needle complex protein [Escherichia fergusonii]MBA8500740.1 type III secretion system needle complex protein [Escherichia fergusonii]QCZ31452.1 type III secretion system needle complex protein [Escherichia fergusonii]HAI1306448.1 type III secretion system needle complex protein [Escherichia fergusonii]HCO8235809.1 type III secretion system needle complex protein [Escherichia fergu
MGQYIYNISEKFRDGVGRLEEEITEALDKLAQEPSNPQYLAVYQAKLAEYTTYRNAQSSVVKAYKDLDSTIIQNFR